MRLPLIFRRKDERMLDDLPHFRCTTEPPRTREQSLREDVVFEAESVEHVAEETLRRVAAGIRPKRGEGLKT